jgi:protein SCO1/2
VNTKALYAVMLALLFPLVAYFIVKKYSETAVVMPGHFIYDSVVDTVKNGKQYSDTIWHQVSDFLLTNQLGEKVSFEDLKKKDTSGKIVIADFFFTHCPTICVPMARNMSRLQRSITNAQKVGDQSPGFVQFISFSIDPERDSVSQLKKWADRFQIDPEQWWLLTGDKKTIYNLSLNEMNLGLADGNGDDTSFFHSDKFVLIDRDRHIRGYYDGLDSASLAKLSNDIILLALEKNPKEKSFFAGKLQLIAVVFLLVILGLGLFFYFFRKRSPQTSIDQINLN